VLFTKSNLTMLEGDSTAYSTPVPKRNDISLRRACDHKTDRSRTVALDEACSLLVKGSLVLQPLSVACHARDLLAVVVGNCIFRISPFGTQVVRSAYLVSLTRVTN
jgi:hypothetical protein